MYRSGEEYMQKFGDPQFMARSKMYGFGDDKIQEMRKEVIALFDELSGNKTSDLKTFEMAVFVGYKD